MRSPLLPLLANVLLDEVDKELETRGHAFVRYADDCNVYVRSKRAGERVMAAMRGLFAKLRLRINESKSAVAPPWTRKFLGYSFWVAKGREVKRRVARKALETMKHRVRVLTKRSRGRSVDSVVAELRGYLLGWKAYFQLADTPGVFRDLDGWIRRRLRSLQLSHWKNASTVYRELRKLGASDLVAKQVAANVKNRWRNARTANTTLPVSYFDDLGLPRLAA